MHMASFIWIVVLAFLGIVAARDYSTVPPRTITTIEGAHSIEFSLRKQSNPAKSSRLVFLFTTLGFPRFRADYFHVDSDSVEAFKFRVGLAAAVEFNDGGPPGFDPTDRANIVRKISFLGLGTFWSDIHALQQYRMVSMFIHVQPFFQEQRLVIVKKSL